MRNRFVCYCYYCNLIGVWKGVYEKATIPLSEPEKRLDLPNEPKHPALVPQVSSPSLFLLPPPPLSNHENISSST